MGELPDEKVTYDESFLIIWGILDISILLNDVERMKKWVDKIFVADPEREIQVNENSGLARWLMR